MKRIPRRGACTGASPPRSPSRDRVGTRSPPAPAAASAWPAGSCLGHRRRPEAGRRRSRTGPGRPSAEAQVAAFEKKYPNVKVKLVNAGTNNNEYTKLQNAIKAGSGRPGRRAGRVLRHAAVRARPTRSSTCDQYGFDKLEVDVHARPLGFGERRRQARRAAAGLRPHGAVLQQEGLRQVRHRRAEDLGRVRRRRARSCTPPTRTPTSPATPATPGFTTSMIWQAGGKPFKVDGTKVAINLPGRGHQEVDRHLEPAVSGQAACADHRLERRLVQGLGAGSIATLDIGAWMPGVLESR